MYAAVWTLYYDVLTMITHIFLRNLQTEWARVLVGLPKIWELNQYKSLIVRFDSENNYLKEKKFPAELKELFSPEDKTYEYPIEEAIEK